MTDNQPIKALILSGGGGRGAFHAGVYQYLMSDNKENVSSSHAGPWNPDIIVGTSIGAVNGAAIAQGMAAEELVNVWKSLEEKDIQGIPPRMRSVARWIVHLLFGQLMQADLPRVDPAISTSPDPNEYWPPLPFVPSWVADRFVGRWINLLDTGPLKETLISRFKFDQDKLTARSLKAWIIFRFSRNDDNSIQSSTQVMAPPKDLGFSPRAGWDLVLLLSSQGVIMTMTISAGVFTSVRICIKSNAAPSGVFATNAPSQNISFVSGSSVHG